MTVSATAFIHETAVVEPGAIIGDHAKVWHHCHIRQGAVVGADTNLGKNVYVDRGAVIGDGCKVQNNVSVYAGVTLEASVFVGPSAVFTNDLWPRASNSEWTLVPTLVRTGATVGANATIVCGVTIGRHAFVGAGSVVTRDVDDQQLVVGNPARPAGWVCTCGEKIASSVQKPTSGIRCPSCGADSFEP